MMIRSRFGFWFFLVLVAVGSTTAHAGGKAAIELVDKVLAGKDKPTIGFVPYKPIKKGVIKVTRADGKVFTFRARNLRTKQRKRFTLQAKMGETQFDGEAVIDFVDGDSQTVPLRFTVLIADELKVEVQKDTLDPKTGDMSVVLSREAGWCDYDVHLDDNLGPIQGKAEFEGEPGGTVLAVNWTPRGPEDVVLRIDLTCYDTHGFSNGWVLSPWWLELPHEDVIFESGEAKIVSHETPKLERALDELRKAIRRYSHVVEVKLFISGHTDTVGSRKANLALSRRRARAIGRYFRKRGISVPIFFTGFGEDEQAVDTQDSVDEPLNRRARYFISQSPPVDSNWQGL